MFNPKEPDWRAIHTATEKLVPTCTQAEGEGPLRLLADLVEQRAIAIGALQASDAQQSAEINGGPDPRGTRFVTTSQTFDADFIFIP